MAQTGDGPTIIDGQLVNIHEGRPEPVAEAGQWTPTSERVQVGRGLQAIQSYKFGIYKDGQLVVGPDSPTRIDAWIEGYTYACAGMADPAAELAALREVAEATRSALHWLDEFGGYEEPGHDAGLRKLTADLRSALAKLQPEEGCTFCSDTDPECPYCSQP